MMLRSNRTQVRGWMPQQETQQHAQAKETARTRRSTHKQTASKLDLMNSAAAASSVFCCALVLPSGAVWLVGAGVGGDQGGAGRSRSEEAELNLSRAERRVGRGENG
eukprot:766498-Hanusia_phi.AAC.3